MSAELTQYVVPSIVAGVFGVAGVVIGGHLQRRKNDADITKQITETALSLIEPLRLQNSELKARLDAQESAWKSEREEWEKERASLIGRIEKLEAENSNLQGMLSRQNIGVRGKR